MFDRMTRFRRDRQGTGLTRPGAHGTPRGSVLVLVMAILGILFVTGVAFLMTMNFEARLIRSGERAAQEEAGIDRIEQVTGALLKGEFVTVPGVSGGSGPLGKEEAGKFHLAPSTWAELPVVHGLISQVEPYVGAAFNRVFGYVTDIETLRDSEFDADTIFRNEINTFRYVGEHVNPAHPDDPIVVDADGDGIVDTLQVNLSDMGFSRSQLTALSKAVNDPFRSSENVYLGLRVIPHGAMVDLDDSHPNLIVEATGVNRDSNQVRTRMQRPYSPMAEEASLRWRFFIPQRTIPSSAIQGNPADGTAEPSAGGDFGSQLFWPLEDPFPSHQTVRTGEHRYWPFELEQMQDWAMRLDPGYSTAGQYDRRHLVTTISHDDNLMRGAQVEHRDDSSSPFRRVDVLGLMTEAVLDDLPPNNDPCELDPLFRFQYVAYPHTLVSGYYTKSTLEPGWVDYSKGDPLNWCECERRRKRPYEDCSHDLRMGRLRLSLPWLDTAVEDGEIVDKQRMQLIQEAFLMLLLNARGTTWGEFKFVDTDGDGHPDDDDGDGIPDARVWHRDDIDFDHIHRTAASLTANMIDFMDEDDDPTGVEVRWFNFSDENWINAPDPGLAREEWLKKVGRGTCDLQAAGAVGPDGSPINCEYVYGLERQPFITEIAAMVDDDNPPDGDLDGDPAYAVELFNPYDEPIDLSDYFLRVALGGPDIPLTGAIPVERFLVVVNDKGPLPDGHFQLSAGVLTRDVSGFDPTLEFENGNTIYLVRDNPDFPGDPDQRIVVDEFDVTGSIADLSGNPGVVWSVGRKSVGLDEAIGLRPWFAPIPADPADEKADEHRLGEDNRNTGYDADLRPVEVLFANTGNFRTAFPTTGSLLLLMREANRTVTAFVPDAKYAFTAHLRGGTVEVSTQIDNGRMPVFDTGLLHHIDPAGDDLTTAYVTGWDLHRPGELMHLPWGQLVFDYFTALPLSNWGPYRDPDGVQEDAKPRVDLEGLRVHGRINLNAAPWKVLSGLPFVPMEDIPDAFRDTFTESLLLTGTPEDEASILGEELAMAIVAYREARGLSPIVLGPPFRTGDYDAKRGWTASAPAMRRGTGFMAVGELANVRAANPFNYPEYRIDSDVEVGSNGNYLKAIAVLACLGDWVTVRSHVFTVYGVLRGQEDETIIDPNPDVQNRLRAAEVNSRALRFQETVDRLPTFLGERTPLRIGDRAVSKYRDTLND